MPKFTSPLDHVSVAAPCPADWDRMVGDDRARFCNQCSLHVYNLSGMTRREAETFVSNAEGRVCVRYYRRRDGTVLTKNCPVGLRAIKQKVSRVAGSVLSAVLGFYTGAWLHVGLNRFENRRVMGEMAFPATPPPEQTVTFIKGMEPVGQWEPGAVVGRYVVDEVPVKKEHRSGTRASKRVK